MEQSNLRRLLSAVREHKGTDLILKVGSSPLIRIHGDLRRNPTEPEITLAMMHEFLDELLEPAQRAQFEEERELDFAFSPDESRFRGNAYFQRGNPTLALRLMHSSIPSFDDIGLPYAIREMVAANQGLVLFTGPTGSGKSTSMACMIDAINRSRPCHIITIEDPVEYIHDDHTAVLSQREIGADSLSFARALRAALREDPDVVLVGEMRDPETISITLTLAETGHLVISSLHTNDASQALDRIVDVFPADRQDQIRLQLASMLSAIVAQRLVPKIGGGLVAAYECLVATSAVSNLIREGKTRQIRNAMQLGQAEGNQTFEMSLNHLVALGIISYETALSHAFVPNDIITPIAGGHRRVG